MDDPRWAVIDGVDSGADTPSADAARDAYLSRLDASEALARPVPQGRQMLVALEQTSPWLCSGRWARTTAIPLDRGSGWSLLAGLLSLPAGVDRLLFITARKGRVHHRGHPGGEVVPTPGGPIRLWGLPGSRQHGAAVATGSFAAFWSVLERSAPEEMGMVTRLWRGKGAPVSSVVEELFPYLPALDFSALASFARASWSPSHGRAEEAPHIL